MNKKVLVIEDDSFLLNLEVSNLEKSNFEVITALTGEEAMKKINELDISIILLDIMLPDYDGFDILKRIKEDNNLKKIPVIIFSNLSSEKDIEKAKELGAADFMVKSNFTLKELIERVNRILLNKN
jgi:DNA-binding response OmpR family regulator